MASTPVVKVVSVAGSTRADDARPPAPQIKIELDERCLLLPDGKIVQHMLFQTDMNGDIAMHGVFAFNASGRTSHLVSMSAAQAGEFAAELVHAVYAAKTSFMFGDSLSVTINVIANGYKLEFADGDQGFDLFLSTGVIWRFIKGLLLAIDAAQPPRALPN